MPALEEYSRTELERLEHERQEAIKAKGGLPFLPKLQVGVTRIYLEAEMPKESLDPNGNMKKLFTVKLPNGTDKFAWSINPRSPLYRELLVALPKAPVWLDVIRTGDSKTDTRYSLRIVA